jgi:hypothetical protein
MKNWRLGILGLVGLLALAACDQAPAPPHVLDDPAGLVKPAERQRLEHLRQRLLQEFDIDLRLMILERRPENLDYAAATLFDRYLFNNLTRGARGVLLLVDPQGGTVRMEVGYDLATIFPNGFEAYVEERQMAPFFAAGRVAEGLAATLELLVDMARGDLAGSVYAGAFRVTPEPGGTVRPAVFETSRQALDDRGEAAKFGPQPTPLTALAAYREALRHSVEDPDLELYTPESRQFLGRWQVTAAQQENELRSLEMVWPAAEVIVSGSLAAIRFPLEERRHAPYFLRRHQAGWQLDLAARSRLVVFNSHNQWHFSNLDHGFMFAFRDWRFDAGGFPHRVVEKGKF